MKKTLRKAIAPIAIGAFASLAIYAGAVRSPKEDSMPKLTINETPYEDVSTNKIVFAREDPNLLQLPKPRGGDMLTEGFYSKIGRYVSDNKTVCNLAKAYNDTIFIGGLMHTPQRNGYYTEEQQKMWLSTKGHGDTGLNASYSGEIHHQIVAKSIEYALTQSKMSDGRVDLEDTLSIALLGKEKVDKAKRSVDSTQFARYITAKDSKGNYIINKGEQRFLKEWLSQVYYNDDPRVFNKN